MKLDNCYCGGTATPKTEESELAHITCSSCEHEVSSKRPLQLPKMWKKSVENKAQLQREFLKAQQDETFPETAQ